MSCPCGTGFCFICGKEADGEDDHWVRGGCPRYNQPGDRDVEYDDDGYEDEDEDTGDPLDDIQNLFGHNDILAQFALDTAVSEEGAADAVVQQGAGTVESTQPAEIMTRAEQRDGSPADLTSAAAEVEGQVLIQGDEIDHGSDSVTSMYDPNQPPRGAIAEGSRDIPARSDHVSTDRGDFNLTADELTDHLALWEIFADLQRDRENRAAALLGRSA